ncbi:hypothetical protein SAMN05216345_105120 [Cupriavidus sp. YR651]|nr:hypothetical protein SAMN05216345_105120 [Cupriavidus sp. YR651]
MVGREPANADYRRLQGLPRKLLSWARWLATLAVSRFTTHSPFFPEFADV